MATKNALRLGKIENMSDDDSTFDPHMSRQPFHTTQWSVVAAAGRTDEGALADLCNKYWQPVYAFLRRRGQQSADASDTAQAFFARLLEKNVVQAADPDRGRFRTFLLAALKNFMANEFRDGTRLKRGGGQTIVAINPELGDAALTDRGHAADEFDRIWAQSVVASAMNQLQAEHADAGQLDSFERLRPFLSPSEKLPTYAQVAEADGLTEGQVKVSVHRLRQRFRDLVRGEIAATLSDENDVEDEYRLLLEALA